MLAQANLNFHTGARMPHAKGEIAGSLTKDRRIHAWRVALGAGQKGLKLAIDTGKISDFSHPWRIQPVAWAGGTGRILPRGPCPLGWLTIAAPS